MKKGFDYKRVTGLTYECNCTGITQRKWDMLMHDVKVGNKTKINQLVRVFLPELYNSLALNYPNPYTYYWTETHLIVVHSSIEYFLRYEYAA